jgi:hypothetical protein
MTTTGKAGRHDARRLSPSHARTPPHARRGQSVPTPRIDVRFGPTPLPDRHQTILCSPFAPLVTSKAKRPATGTPAAGHLNCIYNWWAILGLNQ